MAIEHDAILDTDDTNDQDLFLDHFLKRTDAQRKLSDKRDEENPREADWRTSDQEDPKDAQEPSEEETQDAGEEEEEEKRYVEDGGAYVKIKIGDEEHEVPIKDLQRLYGQEASLTQKSMQIAAKRKEIEQTEANHLAASTALLQYARQRFEPYRQIDFLSLSRDERISQEQFQALRAEAEDRWNELQFLEQQTGQFVQALQTKQNEVMVASAKEAVKVLMDEESPYHIPDWSDTTYNGIRQFAVTNGLDKNIVDAIVDPAAIKLLHMAKLYSEGQSKIKTTKVGNKVTKVVKTSRSMSSSQRSGKGNKSAEERLRASGSDEDAIATFLGRWAE